MPIKLNWIYDKLYAIKEYAKNVWKFHTELENLRASMHGVIFRNIEQILCSFWIVALNENFYFNIDLWRSKINCIKNQVTHLPKH